jgi:hypothetical protein
MDCIWIDCSGEYRFLSPHAWV